MKTVLSILLITSSSYYHVQSINVKDFIGAWEFKKDSVIMTKIYSAEYFSVAIYNPHKKTFIGTMGGSWHIDDNKITEKYEFDSQHADNVGKEIHTSFSFKGESLTLKTPSGNERWTRIDNGTPGKLAGAWLITGRVENGEIKWRTPGVRKTMKILSGSRFQWIAYNTETKEFFGTGGGTYTTEDGKYTENIEFFSRDNSRVGASLQFDFSIEEGTWRHKGLSSKGDPIDEVWTQREVLEN